MNQKLVSTGLIVFFLIILVATGILVFDRIYQFTLASDILPNFTIEDNGADAVSYDAGQPLPRWTGTDRVNILVMGIDQRQNEDGPWRTDTMLVLTVDPVTMSGGMLSIPRDLWVPSPVPDYPEGRINQAHFFGDVWDYPGGGPALAVKTVEYNLGIPIDYYVRVNFTAFEELVDMIGPVHICVDEKIEDPTYPARYDYGYDPFYLDAGCHDMDGATALKYARTRHSGGGDFDRARRQQQVIKAIFEKVTSLDMLPQLAQQAPEMWEALQGAVVTDMKLDEIIALARLASELDTERDVRYRVIDENYTDFGITPDGQQVLIPLRGPMRELRDEVFASGPPLPDDADPAAILAAEAATIQVLNGTVTPGLAKTTYDYLLSHGLQMMDYANAAHSSYVKSQVIMYTDKTYTADYVTNLLGLPGDAVVHGTPSADVAYDISIILGTDYVPATPTIAP